MIRFTVLWRKELLDELATLWCDYPRREEISSAANRIDTELLVDAHVKGDVLDTGQKRLTLRPLTVYYRVDEGDRKVFVEAIRLTESN